MGFVEFIKRLSNKSTPTTSDDSMSSMATGHRTTKDRSSKISEKQRVIKEFIPSYNRRSGGLVRLIHEVNQCVVIPPTEKGLIAMMLCEAWYETAHTEGYEKRRKVFKYHIMNILEGAKTWPVVYDALKQILGRVE